MNTFLSCLMHRNREEYSYWRCWISTNTTQTSRNFLLNFKSGHILLNGYFFIKDWLSFEKCSQEGVHGKRNQNCLSHSGFHFENRKKRLSSFENFSFDELIFNRPAHFSNNCFHLNCVAFF